MPIGKIVPRLLAVVVMSISLAGCAEGMHRVISSLVLGSQGVIDDDDLEGHSFGNTSPYPVSHPADDDTLEENAS